MSTTILTPVVGILGDKCINCYACISACPAKYCIDGSGDKPVINPDLCIGCGNCIAACTHNAMCVYDDTSHFIGDLKRGDKMVAVASSAASSFFPGKHLNLNGYLKSLGVDAVFDAGFGADLAAVSCVNFIRGKKPRMVIAQSCPAIVTYIEIYHPELLPYLAPVDSPVLHTIRMIREYYPQYKDHKIAVISPCLAMRRELDETNCGDYNVTFLSLKELLDKKNTAVGSFPAVEYSGAHAEEAAQCPTPVSLLEAAERQMPGLGRKARKIEGVHAVYPYLQDVAGLLEKQGIKFPQLVDCLSCQKGCNGGPGTKNGRMAIDELESPVRQRNADLEERSTAKQMEKVYRKYSNTLNKFWKPGLYERKYRDLSGNFDVTPPDGEQLKDIYESLNKFTENDLLDCTACGYETCKSMAAAIFYGLNKPENCTSYNISRLEKEKKTQAGIPDESKEQIKRALCIVDEINKAVNVLNDRVNSQVKAVDGSSAITGKIFESLKSTTDLSRQKQDAMKELIDNAAKGRESMHETILSVEEISRSVDGIASAIKIISGIAANTKLLAMNAAIEAAHAGDAGRGFAVVADEIRRLSETTGENSRNISKTLSNIIDGISVTSKRSTETNSMIESMSREIGDFTGTMAELAGILTELSSGSGEITAGLNTLGELASSIKTSCTEMLSMTGELKDGMENLSAGRQ